MTGGTRGIGAAIARVLVEAGHRVIVTGTSSAGQAPQGCQYLACDFTHRAALTAFAEEMAARDLAVLVNNAGINEVAPLEEYDAETFERLHQVNVTAPFILCSAVVPGMRKRRFGRIVNITSIFSVVSKAGRAAYSASKAGLVGLSRALALEVAADNVLVNCLAPGFVDTALTRHILGAGQIRHLAARIPIGRLAQPEEIAQWVRFLASEENTYLTGQNLLVDGGFTCE